MEWKVGKMRQFVKKLKEDLKIDLIVMKKGLQEYSRYAHEFLIIQSNFFFKLLI